MIKPKSVSWGVGPRRQLGFVETPSPVEEARGTWRRTSEVSYTRFGVFPEDASCTHCIALVVTRKDARQSLEVRDPIREHTVTTALCWSVAYIKRH